MFCGSIASLGAKYRVLMSYSDLRAVIIFMFFKTVRSTKTLLGEKLINQTNSTLVIWKLVILFECKISLSRKRDGWGKTGRLIWFTIMHH